MGIFVVSAAQGQVSNPSKHILWGTTLSTGSVTPSALPVVCSLWRRTHDYPGKQACRGVVWSVHGVHTAVLTHEIGMFQRAGVTLERHLAFLAIAHAFVCPRSFVRASVGT